MYKTVERIQPASSLTMTTRVGEDDSYADFSIDGLDCLLDAKELREVIKFFQATLKEVQHK